MTRYARPLRRRSDVTVVISPRARYNRAMLGLELAAARGPRIHFLGTGTPMGQGGLHQACILVETPETKLLLDCGMTALTSLGRAGIDPAEVDAVVISHLHGDHFGTACCLAPVRGSPATVAGSVTASSSTAPTTPATPPRVRW